jgi:NADH-quinone oxidoreductase subunit H
MPLLAVDPLLRGDFGWEVAGIVLLKAAVAFGLLLVSVIMMVWFERKVIGDLQNRIGPNKAGPFGLLQTVADGMKLILKEDLVPDKADRRVFVLAPYLSVVPAFVTFAIVPIGGGFDGGADPGQVSLFGNKTFLQLADPPVGILLMLAMSSIAVYGVLLAGWSSGSKYPLLGAVRGSAQMISYEAALGLAVVTVVMMTGSLSTHDIVVQQSGNGYDAFGFLPLPRWNLIATGIVPFVIFYIAATAELNRPPFDLVEAEQELVGGYSTEYSSFRFALFYLAEFMSSIVMSAIIVTLFLGGPAGPTPLGPGWLWGIVWFALKLLVFLFALVWVRATLPRIRYDQLMNIGWRVLIPLALGWLLLLATINVGRDHDWNLPAVVGGGFVVLVAAYAALVAAVAVAERRRETEEELVG